MVLMSQSSEAKCVCTLGMYGITGNSNLVAITFFSLTRFTDASQILKLLLMRQQNSLSDGIKLFFVRMKKYGVRVHNFLYNRVTLLRKLVLNQQQKYLQDEIRSLLLALRKNKKIKMGTLNICKS